MSGGGRNGPDGLQNNWPKTPAEFDGLPWNWSFCHIVTDMTHITQKVSINGRDFPVLSAEGQALKFGDLNSLLKWLVSTCTGINDGKIWAIRCTTVPDTETCEQQAAVTFLKVSEVPRYMNPIDSSACDGLAAYALYCSGCTV
jgi:hypothetical protein